jgi:hypothetical protein
MPEQPIRIVPIVINPWEALDSERLQHRRTLERFVSMWNRAQVMDGRSAMSTKICKLCEDIPTSSNLSWRSTCPLHTSVEYVRVQLGRLAKPYRRQKPKEDGTENPPPPEA